MYIPKFSFRRTKKIKQGELLTNYQAIINCLSFILFFLFYYNFISSLMKKALNLIQIRAFQEIQCFLHNLPTKIIVNRWDDL